MTHSTVPILGHYANVYLNSAGETFTSAFCWSTRAGAASHTYPGYRVNSRVRIKALKLEEADKLPAGMLSILHPAPREIRSDRVLHGPMTVRIELEPRCPRCGAEYADQCEFRTLHNTRCPYRTTAGR